jgi:UDP-4-amino-4,6-dideoxy-N-acetyl-beta-L-altrosamine transaminase
MSTKKYSYGRQFIDNDDIKAVSEVLKSDWLTQGPKIKEFEDALSEKFKSKFVSVVSNGTAALHLAALALAWKRDDIVITSPITFLASANCILYVHATPDFVDIDPVSYTIDVNKLEDKLKSYRLKDKKVKAVIGVDYAGHPCNWTALRSLADKYSFQLVNDACHALGATYKGDIGYAVKYADLVSFSFHPVKHITTGEGGAILTNNEMLDEKIKILRTHGTTKDGKLMEKNDGPWYHEMIELGFNYRITDFQCALGISQLKRLDFFFKRRRQIAEYYNKNLINKDLFILPCEVNDVRHAYHLYPLQIKFDKIGYSKKDLFEKLNQKNIKAQVHYIPVHLQPYYKKHYGFKIGDFPVAEEFYSREVSIPIYPSLENEDLRYISEKVKELVPD